MTPRKRENASALRREAGRLLTEISAELDALLDCQGFRKGSLYLWRHRCGRSGCHCAKGDLHEHWVFSTPHEGRLVKRYIAPEDLERVRRQVDAYRRFRRALRRLRQAEGRLKGILERLAEALDEERPP